MKYAWLVTAALFHAGVASAVTTAAPEPATPSSFVQAEAAAAGGEAGISPLLAGAPPASAMPSPGMAVKLYDNEAQASVPVVTGLLAALGVVLAAGIGAQLLRRRRAPPETRIDFRAGANDFAPAAPDGGFARADPLRHFQPDAPPVTPSATERSRPDYIRIDDTVEVWTPARVEAERTPAVRSRRRRRTDAAGADYRFHRLNGDGTVKSVQRKKFTTDVAAQGFAATLGNGNAVEVWLDDRKLTTIPATSFA